MSRPSLSSLRPASQLAVPDLLLDFPTPPSYIPPSPSGNPPPSLPPSGPLPPVPGPSPISQQDLSVIQRSRISVGSFTSRRSASPNGSVHTFGNPHHHGRKDSQSSMRSYASSASLAVPGAVARPTLRSPRSPHSPRAEAISEGDEDSSSIAHTSLADLPRLTPSPRPPPTSDELASIDMHDLPSDDDDDGPLDPRALHMQMRAARSKSTTHKSRLGTMDTPRSRRPSSPTRAASPDVATMIATTPRPRRPSSPSSARPRSRVRSAGSTLSSSSSGGRGRYASSTFSHSSLPYAASVASSSRAGTEDWNEDSFIDDYGTIISGGDGLRDFDGASNYDEAEATERVGTEGGDDDSDSSLDLHTPLPNLMLRHGMLSPNSKLLVGGSRAGTPADRPGSTLSVNSAMTKSGHYRDDRDTLQRRVRHRDGKLLRAGMGLTTGLGWSDSEDEDAPSALTRRLSNLALARQNSTRSLGSSTSRTPSRPSRLTRSASSDAQSMPTRSRTKSRPSAPPSSYAKPPISAPPLPSLSSSQSLRPSDPGRTRSLGDEPSLDLDDDEGASTSTGSTSLRTPDGFELGYPPPRARPWDREKSLPPLPRSLSRGPSVLSRQPSTTSTAAPNLRRQPSSKGLRADAAAATPSQIAHPTSGSATLSRKPSGKSLRHQPSTKSLVPKPSVGSLRHKSSAKSLRPPSKFLPDPPVDTSRTTPASSSYTASTPVSPYSTTSTSSHTSSPASQYARRASEPDERHHAPPTTPRTPRPLLTASLSSPNIMADMQAQPIPPLPPKATSAMGAYHRPGRVSGLPRTTSQPTLADGEKPRPRTGTGMVYRKSSGTSRMPARPPPPPNGLGYSGTVMI